MLQEALIAIGCWFAIAAVTVFGWHRWITRHSS